MAYQFIPVVLGVAAASCYIESMKRKVKKQKNKIEIPKNTIKLIDKEPQEIKQENINVK